MTTWRERGYVPNSEGEDSAEELETQETLYGHDETNEQGEDGPIERLTTDVSKLSDATQQPTKDEGLMDIDNGEMDEGKSRMKATVAPELREDALATEDADFMDIDSILGVATHPQNIPANIPVLDLSRPQAEEKEIESVCPLFHHSPHSSCLQNITNFTKEKYHRCPTTTTTHHPLAHPPKPHRHPRIPQSPHRRTTNNSLAHSYKTQGAQSESTNPR